jgi:hypothetical protein
MLRNNEDVPFIYDEPRGIPGLPVDAYLTAAAPGMPNALLGVTVEGFIVSPYVLVVQMFRMEECAW